MNLKQLIAKLLWFKNEAVCRVSDSCLPGFVSGAQWGWGDARVLIGKWLDETRLPTIPDSAVCFFKDGERWCCVNGEFVNLQESPAGFGETFEEALDSLRSALPHSFVASGRLDDDTCARCDKCFEEPIHNGNVARFCDDSGL